MKKTLALSLLFIIFCAPGIASAREDARAALLYNLTTGAILYQYNPDLRIAPASLTKIMTMFLVMDAIKAKKLSYAQKATISREAASAGGSTMGLRAGEKVPIVRLLAGAAVLSGNDAATALAEKVGGSQAKFVGRMNAKAASLGMKKTRFRNATGLPAAGQKTTARDLLSLCKAYIKIHPEALRFHNTLYLLHRGSVARNTNPLLGTMAGVDGLKTGWTIASGYNLIATAKRGKTRLLAIVLGGATKADRENMARRLLDAGFKYPGSPRDVKKFMGG